MVPMLENNKQEISSFERLLNTSFHVNLFCQLLY